MTPSQQCKQAGLKSLAELSEITGRGPRTLQYWAAHDPKLFAVVVAGAVAVKDKKRME